MSVADVLDRAADLLEERRWVRQRTCRSSDPRLTALQAITLAADELAGGGPDSADLHTDALDAVCRHVLGQRCGSNGASVSQWESRPARAAGRNRWGPIPAQSALTASEVVAVLRDVARTASPAPFAVRVSGSEAPEEHLPPATPDR